MVKRYLYKGALVIIFVAFNTYYIRVVAYYNDNSSYMLATLKKSKMGLRYTSARFIRYISNTLIVLAKGAAKGLE